MTDTINLESLDNLIQVATTLISAIICIRYYILSKKQEWALLFLYTFVCFLGDLYYQLFFVFYGSAPNYSYIPYYSWYSSFLFLGLLLVKLRGDGIKRNLRFLWPALAFTGGMCIFFINWGEYLANIICAILMAVLIWESIDGLFGIKKESGNKNRMPLYILVLLFVTAEYIAWVSSCFWVGNTLKNPYFWADTFISLYFVALPFALRKAVVE